ncbi:ATP-binding protein [Stagnimonas aquatica]|uniref:histidine kinase n=1 Tax=Stagnimonas aquatica TaxID=2689987 RepID=A0A3N0V4V6_9GAMM|nr:ATP-binding protein [Stagnimonas aquatica]ROH87799.1 ATP-binding protein [Stagnimonas aquatica]
MSWLALIITAALALVAALLWRRQRRLQDELVRLRGALATDVASERLKAAAEERRRLLADLHDDIGAKLLNLVHALERPEQADLVRSVVQDFRDVVSRTNQDACTLLQALGQIREETEARLEAAGSRLDWQQAPDTPDPDLDEAQVLHLFRIAREAVTNALRHGQATRIRMRVRAIARTLVFDVTDDGPGLAAAELTQASGRGTAGMRHRAEALHGSIDWAPGTTGGTKVILQFPLH